MIERLRTLNYHRKKIQAETTGSTVSERKNRKMNNNTVLEIKHYSKTYGEGKKAVDDISLDVMSGDIYGFIGHNGAGKSTLIKAIAGSVTPDSGEIYVDGKLIPNMTTKKSRSFKLL